LQEFRAKHGFTPREMHAFLYDFAPRVVAAERDVELPPPSRVWFTMGGINNNGDFGTLDSADESSQSMWQGNIETRRGDVIMMWCVSPRSYLHSIWRATDDGFADPFFYFYSVIRIGKCIKVPPVHFKEFACDPTLAQNPFVRSHFQGAGGKPFPLEDYLTVLDILRGKGFDVSCLPIPPSQVLDLRKDLECERDIEAHLVEPMLKSLGYTEDDWIRQMPLRMGRGERNYPDYAVDANPKRGEESAAFLVEAKYEIATKKQLDDAYLQGKSYALRLQSHAFLLAAKEGVWLFLRSEEFSRERSSRWTWSDLEHPDRLHELSSRIGKESLSARRRSPRPRGSRSNQGRFTSDVHFTS
jgi:hypothetical protein